jgi:hypothetical protein
MRLDAHQGWCGRSFFAGFGTGVNRIGHHDLLHLLAEGESQVWAN